MHGRRLSMERARSGQRAVGRRASAGAPELREPRCCSCPRCSCQRQRSSVGSTRSYTRGLFVCAWRTAAGASGDPRGLCVCIVASNVSTACACARMLPPPQPKRGQGTACRVHGRGVGFSLVHVGTGGLRRIKRQHVQLLSRHFGGNALKATHHVSCKLGRGHEHQGLGAHNIRECPGSSRVVRRAVLGQVVHLRAWRRKPCLNGCLHTRAGMRSFDADAAPF